MNVANKQSTSKLLVIDDDEGITDLIKTITMGMEFRVNCVHDYESIGSTYQAFNPDIIFLDLKLPGYDGVEVLHYLADVGCRSKIFLISGVDKTTLESAGEVGRLNHLNVVGALKKPFTIDDVEKVLREEMDTAYCFTSTEFQNVLDPGEFHILYQPCMAIKSLGGQGLSDVDVTVNWYGRAGSRFMPVNDYYPRLESAGVATEFSHAVLEHSIEAFAAWMERGLEFGLVIRLQDSMYHDDTLASYLQNLSRKFEVPPEKLTLGISESEVMSGSTAVLDVLTRLRINGFNISAQVSNPETSELERLLHLPVNELRLSSSLIGKVPGNVDIEFDVSTLISMCTKHDLLTRADGIEKDSTLKFLFDCGCTTGLGGLFSNPLSIHDVERFVSVNEYDPEPATISL